MSKKKIEENNLTPKILALIIAIILWSYVMDEVDPMTTVEYRDIKVEYVNADELADKGLIILEPKESTISVEVAGKKSDMGKGKFSENNISAKVNLEDMVIGKNTVPVELKLINNISNIRLVDYKPREVVFEIDQISEERKDVTHEIIGDLEEGYVLGDIEIEPSTIKVVGPKSYINKIHRVVAKIDLTDKKESFNKTVPLEILDIDDNEIKGLSREPSMINVSVPISKKQTVPINLVTKNEAPQSYKVLEMTINPAEVAIKVNGKNQDIKSINTKPIDINDLIGKTSHVVELDLPKGVELSNPNEKIVLTYKLEELGTKIFNYKFSDLNILNLNENLEIAEESKTSIISVILDENNPNSQGVDQSMVKLSIDLNGLEAGNHRVEIKVEGVADDVIKSVSPRSISVDLKEKE